MICDCCRRALRCPGSSWCNECDRGFNGATEPATTSWLAWLGVLIIVACALWSVFHEPTTPPQDQSERPVYPPQF